MENLNMKQAALKYAEQGIEVFPVVPKRDQPFGSWYQIATAEAGQIEKWWNQNPRFNVGIKTGAKSGFIVVSFKTNEAFEAAAEKGLPVTPMVKKGKGYDVYFRYNEQLLDLIEIESMADISLYGEGSKVLAPPTVLESQPSSVFYKPEVYSWCEGKSIEDVPFADVPAWMLKTDHAGSESPVLVGAPIVQVENVSDVIGCDHAEDVVEAEPVPEAVVKPSNDNKPERLANEWKAPKLFDRYYVDEIKADVLPSWLGGYARAISDSKQTPEGLAVMLGLSMVATCVQKKFVVAPYGDEEYTEPLALWTVTVLRSAERKSPVLNAMRAPLVTWQKEQAELLKDQIFETSTAINIAQRRIEKLSQEATKQEDSGVREKTLNQINDIKRAMPVEVKAPVLWTSDVTAETLQDMLAENDERMSVLSDEGNIFEIMGGLYSDNKVNIDIFLQAYTGSPARIMRKARKVELERPVLTFGLAVQPVVIEAFNKGSKKDFRGKGALGRFLFCIPESMLGKRDVDRRARVPEEIRVRYEGGIKKLLSIPMPQVPQMLTPDDDAYQQWVLFSRKVEMMIAPGGEFEEMGDWGGKLPGNALRIAGLMHLVEHGADSTVIGKDTMDKAVHLCELLTQHAKAAFGMAGAIEPNADAKKVFEWMKDQEFKNFTKTDCYDRFKSWKKGKLDIALSELEKRDIIKPVQELTAGRTATCYISNPALS